MASYAPGNHENSTGWFQYIATEIGKIWNTITQNLNLGSNAITTTNYEVEQAISTYWAEPVLAISPITDQDGLLQIKTGATATTSALELIADDTDTNATYLQLAVSSSGPTAFLEVGGNGTGPDSNFIIYVSSGPQVSFNFGSSLLTIPTSISLTGGVSSDIVGNTGAGTKIGTATTQKLAFYGATPIVQQTGVAVTAAGIHAALVNLGLITA